jgi:CHAT domain-containing protein
VFGLRRALLLAGSEAQVMTLWQVNDAATAQLMRAYYRRLKNGEGRAEALRQVQIAMAGSKVTGESGEGGTVRGTKTRHATQLESTFPGRSHPYYWASFIECGQWTPLH